MKNISPKNINKISLSFLLVSAIITACTTNVNTVSDYKAKISNSQNTFLSEKEISDLDKEYAFSTKDLTESYLMRKLDKWLGLPCDVSEDNCNNINGPKLVKEIDYAMYKHPELFCSIMKKNTSMYNTINEDIPEVISRKEIDPPFKEFLEGCIPPPLTGEFRVNTFTTGFQSRPSMAMDSSGDFVVTWTSGVYSGTAQDGDNNGIYAQRYNSSGYIVGTEFQVNTYTTGVQSNQSVAMDSKGNFVITWESRSQDADGSSGIFAQRFDSNGLKSGSEFQVNTYITRTQVKPNVAMDNSGDFVITWESGHFTGNTQDGDRYGIIARRYDSSGLAQGPEFVVNTYTTNNQQVPAIAMDGAGNFIITWGSFGQDGSSWGIYANMYNKDGESKIPTGCSLPSCNSNTGEFKVNAFTTGAEFLASVAMDSSGDFVIAWQSANSQDGSNYGVFAKRYDSNGSVINPSVCNFPSCNSVTGEFQVNTFFIGKQNSPSTAINSSGDFVISWSSEFQDSSSFGIYAQRYDSSGLAVASEFPVNIYKSNGQNLSSVKMDSNGDIADTWMSWSQDGDSYGIYARRYDSNGVPK
jgi:hypothetical protein